MSSTLIHSFIPYVKYIHVWEQLFNNSFGLLGTQHVALHMSLGIALRGPVKRSSVV